MDCPHTVMTAFIGGKKSVYFCQKPGSSWKTTCIFVVHRASCRGVCVVSCVEVCEMVRR